WHHLLGDGMLDAGDAIPSRDDVSIVIDARDSLIVLDQCVAVLDVAVLTEDRRIEPACVSVGAEVPLEVAYPEDDLGDGGGAGVDLEAEELVRGDGVATRHVERLLPAVRLQGLQDLALQPFQVLERHVEEIPAATGRVEDPDLA